MKRHELSLDKEFYDIISSNELIHSDSEFQHKKMIHVLKKAMVNELTQRQRDCITLYYFNRKSLNEIADTLEIGPPTVSKHLKKARNRLKEIMCYAFQSLEE